MRKLLTGNEAIARGAYEAGVLVASAYPGTPSTEILENISEYKEIYSEWSPNEKVALEVAIGSSIGGARSIVSMKHVGVNVAADPLFTVAYEGVNGGLVLVTADEPATVSSQNEQDNRWYAIHAKLALVEPSDSQECKDFIKEAYKISENYDTPVLFRITTRVCHSKSVVELGERFEAGIKDYIKNPKKYIMLPANSKPKHLEIETQRLPKLQEYSNTTLLNRIEWNDKKIGIVTHGMAYQNAKEALGNNVSYLKIGFSNPMPDKLVKEFADEVEQLYIIEENEPIMENYIKAMGIECKGKEIFSKCGEITPEIIRNEIFKKVSEVNDYNLDLKIPARPPVLCAGCPHRGMFYSVGKKKDKIIANTDIGCYTLGAAPPLNVGEVSICMGSGISTGLGLDIVNRMANRDKKIIGFVGDSTFFHSGMTGLVDAVYNNTSMLVVILDNSITAMTGHQNNPGNGKSVHGDAAPQIDIENLVRAIGIKEKNIRVVDPYNLKETELAVDEGIASTEPFVIISKQPCALIKNVQKERKGLHCQVNQEKCKKCKMCLKTGCPAIFMKNDIVSVDETVCNGCTICKQVCPFEAIEYFGKEQ